MNIPTTLNRRIGALSMAAVLLVAAGCSGDDDTASTATGPPVPTNPATTSPSTDETVTTTSPTTTTPTTTVPPASTSNPTTTPPPATLPPTTSTTVPEVTVTTLVPEADPELLSQRQANPDDVNNNRPIQPEHVPVIESYLEGIQGLYEVYSTAPVDPDSPLAVGAPLTGDALTQSRAALEGRRQRGEVLNVEQGVTFRPWVSGPVGDTATLYDCELAGHYWQDVETGEPIPPDFIWVGMPGRIVTIGVRTEMVFRNGQWLVEGGQIDPAACE